MSKRKLKTLPLKRKVELINEVENNPLKKQRLIAEEFNVPYSTLTTIIRAKEKYKTIATSQKQTLPERSCLTACKKSICTVCRPVLLMTHSCLLSVLSEMPFTNTSAVQGIKPQSLSFFQKTDEHGQNMDRRDSMGEEGYQDKKNGDEEKENDSDGVREERDMQVGEDISKDEEGHCEKREDNEEEECESDGGEGDIHWGEGDSYIEEDEIYWGEGDSYTEETDRSIVESEREEEDGIDWGEGDSYREETDSSIVESEKEEEAGIHWGEGDSYREETDCSTIEGETEEAVSSRKGDGESKEGHSCRKGGKSQRKDGDNTREKGNDELREKSVSERRSNEKAREKTLISHFFKSVGRSVSSCRDHRQIHEDEYERQGKGNMMSKVSKRDDVGGCSKKQRGERPKDAAKDGRTRGRDENETAGRFGGVHITGYQVGPVEMFNPTNACWRERQSARLGLPRLLMLPDRKKQGNPWRAD